MLFLYWLSLDSDCASNLLILLLVCTLSILVLQGSIAIIGCVLFRRLSWRTGLINFQNVEVLKISYRFFALISVGWVRIVVLCPLP